MPTKVYINCLCGEKLVDENLESHNNTIICDKCKRIYKRYYNQLEAPYYWADLTWEKLEHDR